MVRVNNIIALVVFLIVLCAISAVYLLYKSNVDITKVSRYYPDKKIILDEYSFKDDRLVYLVCDRNPSPFKCKIVQERFLQTRGGVKTCDVNLEFEGNLQEDSILVVPFAKNDSAILWEDDKRKLHRGTYVRISIVNFDSCKQTKFLEYNNFTIDQLKNTKKVVPHKFDFDVFYKNTSECYDKECHLHISPTGERFSRSKIPIYNLDSDISNVHSVVRESQEIEYVFVRSHSYYQKQKQVNLRLARYNGMFIFITICI